jgi:hypothetical protein
MKKLSMVGMLLFALAACGGGGSSDFDAFLKIDSEKAVAFAAAGDCTAKAKSVGDWRKANSANYQAMRKKLGTAFPKGPPKEFLDKHGDKMKENKKAVMDTMLECSADPAFSKMMDETKDPE